MLAAVLVLVWLAAAAQASRALTVRTGEKSVVGHGEVIRGDLFITGEQVSVQGTVEGDLYAAGRQVIIEGEVSGDATVAGGGVRVSGSVGGGLRAAARDLAVAGRVGGDAVLVGEKVAVSEHGLIAQDLLFAAEEADLRGPVRGYALGARRKIRVDAAVGGTARFGVEELVLGERAEIGGDLRYASGNEARMAEGARVAGEVTRTAPRLDVKPWEVFRAVLLVGLVGKLLVFIAGLVLGLAAILTVPRWMLGVTGTVKEAPGPCAGWGALVLFATPVGAVAALVTVVGAAVGVLALLLYLAGAMLGQVLAGLLLGRLLLEKRVDLGSPGPLFWSFALGYLLLSTARLVPVAGHLVTLGAALFGFGGMALYWARRRGS
jgi:hypothetical protein